MAIILNIETSTKNCSVSIADSGKIIAFKELNNGNYSHAEVLHPFIENILKEGNISKSEINAIAVSKGPGSYTGSKNWCFGGKRTLFRFKHTININ